ncbi:MAG: hypothetical protein B7Z74_00615 [Deltaproteobacteria bacterium 21-66-5]|nr:MAG: hypothetical protein B7Z74_00615 [Deltaproteobacteria bacterium 21-66-5]
MVPTWLLILSLNTLSFVPLIAGIGCMAVGWNTVDERQMARTTGVGAVVACLAGFGPFAIRNDYESGPDIQIVVPRGYHGTFSVIKDSKHGEDLAFENGMWVLRIPQNGKLRVKTAWPFHRWHQENYIYDDGQPVEVETLDTVAGEIATGPNSSRGSTDYDGTTYRWHIVEDAD